MRIMYNDKSNEVLFSYNIFSNKSILQTKNDIKCCKISTKKCLIMNIKYEEEFKEETIEKIWREMYGEFYDYVENKLFIKPRKKEKTEKQRDYLLLDFEKVYLMNILKYSQLEDIDFNVSLINLSAKERLETQYLEFRKMQNSFYEPCVVCYDSLENPIILVCCRKQICIDCYSKVKSCPHCRSEKMTNRLYINKKYEDYVDLINFAFDTISNENILMYLKNKLL